MPPSEKVTRSEIVAAALAVVDREGLAALSARRVASELKLSTAPVYRHFAAMEELARAVMEAARDQLLAYTVRVYSDRPFLNMGTGIAVFAREHPRLYHALFLESAEFASVIAGFLEQLSADMLRDPRFTAVPRERRDVLLDRMWTYTHGLAALIAVGIQQDTATETIVRSLEGIGQAVIRDVLAG